MIILSACMLSCLLLSGIAVFAGLNVYRSASALASSGLHQLEAGLSQLKAVPTGAAKPSDVTLAKQDFAAAYSDFTQLSNELHGIPGGGTFVPIFGAKLASAARLLPLAIDGARAGMLGSDALNVLLTGLSDPLNSTSPGITQDGLNTISADLAQIAQMFTTDTARVNALQPSDLQLDSRLGPAVAAFRKQLPQIQQYLQDAQNFVQVAPLLLGVGKPANYLVEVLDSTELRPGGGFIGNCGTLTLSGGRLDSVHITDVDLLDRPYEFAGGTEPPSPPWFLASRTLGLRDSNVEADFPTDARRAEQLYQQEATTPPISSSAICGQARAVPSSQLQGVIAITPWMIQRALAITGPISVPEVTDPNYPACNQPITASNLVGCIHHYQLGPGSGSDKIPDPGSLSSQRKKFTGYLFQHFIARVKQIMSTKRPQFVQLLLNSVRDKDLEIFLNPAAGETILQHYHLAATVESPSSDSLFVIDANIIGSKANDFITYTLQDNVTIDASGNAVHQATLTYSWPVSAAATANNVYADPVAKNFYRDYVRVYVPPNAVLHGQSGWDFQGISKAYGRAVFAGFFSMYYGTTEKITLTWTVPNVATSTGGIWQYQELVQRQAGVYAGWHTTLQFSLPSCAKLSGTPIEVKQTGAQSLVAQWQLVSDTTIAASYTCS
jgi:hypothetical protein